MDNDDREIPHHFICPISLQIMKDPVTVVTGITYDRDNIQRWQKQNNTCPVTNQPLPTTSDFTPNHNLRRLIESWCASKQTLVKQSCLKANKEIFINLIKNLKQQELQLEALKSIEKLALLECQEEENRVLLKEVGVVKAMVMIIFSCYRNRTIVGLKEALNVVYLVGFTKDLVVVEHERIIRILTWILDLDDENIDMKFHAIVLLKEIINNAKSQVLERLNRDFFKTIVVYIQQRKLLKKGIKEGLEVMLTTCTWPRNCSIMIEFEVVFELVELELDSPEKEITELIMGLFVHLCSSADGRAQLIGHAAGLAMITKRIGKVSPKVDERALMIISLLSKYSATDGVVQEMVRVGTVEKLCMVLQVNGRHSFPRDKARQILKRHSNVWKDSPCLDVTLLTRYLN